ncbi:MAG: hypothetical protein COU35_00050, partial [Candidatus Magasanikbacteria bacterium CG10_big_fil_rev_8_21_14_0_10_47_10]
ARLISAASEYEKQNDAQKRRLLIDASSNLKLLDKFVLIQANKSLEPLLDVRDRPALRYLSIYPDQSGRDRI